MPGFTAYRFLTTNELRCELITFCIFMPGFTARFVATILALLLWIDYILYFYARLYSMNATRVQPIMVVNWLHFVFLCPALQQAL